MQKAKQYSTSNTKAGRKTNTTDTGLSQFIQRRLVSCGLCQDIQERRCNDPGTENETADGMSIEADPQAYRTDAP